MHRPYIDEYKESCLWQMEVALFKKALILQYSLKWHFLLIDQHTGEVKVLVGGRGDKSGSRTFNRATDSARQPGSSIKPIGAYGPACS